MLLSTYNGAVFLREQLESLYKQTYTNLRILVRDDGSLDHTRNLLSQESAAGKIEQLADHTNLGAAQSFFVLLQEAANSSTQYVAFCDQDDVWLPQKIARAVAALEKTDDGKPRLYCGRAEIVDAELKFIGFTPEQTRPGFGNALVENIAVGCTIVLNRAGLDLLAQNLPQQILIHDWWCYAVVSCFGEILFDSEPLIKYRQHVGNAFGAGGGLRRKFRRFAGEGAGRHWQSEQAVVLLEKFRERMPPAKLALLQRFVDGRSSFAARLSLATTGAIWRQKVLDDLAQRVLFLLNRY